MRYLKVKIGDGVDYYIPLDLSMFQFYEQSRGKYRIGVVASGEYISLLRNDKECSIESIDEFMKEIIDIPDRAIVDLNVLLERKKV